VGYDTFINPVDFSATQLPLAERWNGRRWSIQAVANPPGAHTTALLGLSCGSARTCVAVGFSSRQEDAGGGPMLVERWNGAGWSIQTMPLPADSKPNSGSLNAVSCRSSACTAVGSYVNRFGKQAALVERWDGASWSLQAPVKPRRARQFWFEEVSCPGARACMALGTETAPGGQRTLVESWRGASWSIRRGPSARRRAGYGGLSCTSLRACTTVGATSRVLAERWNGTTWSLQPLARPRGTLDSRLDAVDCVSKSSCTAVGSGETPFVFHQGSGSVALAGHWNGHAWSWQRPRNLGDILDGGQNELYDVSCPSRRICFAVGQYLDARGSTFATLTERWTGR
jgi:hypothetical protein